jgi:hypothetical protein
MQMLKENGIEWRERILVSKLYVYHRVARKTVRVSSCCTKNCTCIIVLHEKLDQKGDKKCEDGKYSYPIYQDNDRLTQLFTKYKYI